MGVALGRRVAKVSIPEKKEASTVLPDLASATIQPRSLCVATGTVLYVLSTLGIGILISTVSRTQQQAFLAGFLFAMPAILLSGVMTPIRAMPFWLQVVTLFNPVRYYVEVLRAVLLKGASFADIWWRLLALLGFGLALLTIASLRFRKRVA
jgi:ABC-2 type transport system permease protein